MIKKILFLGFFFFTSLYAQQYMVQINPNKKIEVKSQTSGIVEYINDDLESSFIKMNEILIKINSLDESIELQREKNSLVIQKQIVKIKERNYQAKNRVKQISRYEKSNEKLFFLESKKELVQTIQNIKKLQNEINKKTFLF